MLRERFLALLLIGLLLYPFLLQDLALLAVKLALIVPALETNS